MSDGAPIPVTVGATVTGIDFALATGGRISGVVRDAATNAPIQGLFVDIVNSAGATAGFAATQANGHLRIDRITAGHLLHKGASQCE